MDVRKLGEDAVLVVAADGPPVAGGEDALGLIGDALSAGAETVAIPIDRLHSDFLSLSSRIAGDVIQKFTNYRLRVAIVGDISEALAGSEALRAFVVESNRGHGVWFVDSLEALEARLAG